MKEKSFAEGSFARNLENQQNTAGVNNSKTWHTPLPDSSNSHTILGSEKPENCPQFAYHSFLQRSRNVATSSAAPMAQTLSPSHLPMHDVYSSEGYFPDSGYVNVSHYTTPDYQEQVLNEHLESALNPQLSIQYGLHDTSTTGPSFGQPHPAQPASSLPASTSTSVTASFQLLSPNLTNTSSPTAMDMGHFSTFSSNDEPAGSAMNMQSLSSTLESSAKLHMPATNLGHSPLSTSSPSAGATASPSAAPAHLKSPIVRVENFSSDDLPPTAPLSRSLSKRSHTSRISATHLSPYPAEDSSVDEGDEDVHRVEQSSPLLIALLHSAERNDDGSWLASSRAGPAGIDPEAREHMQDLYVPTLEEQEKERQVEEKNAEVREWLVHSEVGSEAGDADAAVNEARMRRNACRRRARSTNDAGARPNLGLNASLLAQTAVFGDAHIPGPGVYVDEESGDEDVDFSSVQGIDEPESPPADVRVGSADDETLGHSTTPHTAQGAAFPGQVDLTYRSNDPFRSVEPYVEHEQPDTANAAIMRFRQQVKDIDSASLTATIGSRRRSEPDMGSLFAAPGISKWIADNGKPQERSKALEDQDVAEKVSVMSRSLSLATELHSLLQLQRPNAKTKKTRYLGPRLSRYAVRKLATQQDACLLV